jgi:hypothetical protein
VRPGGLIAFSLYPSLLRPNADVERDEILKQASCLGKVELKERLLLYETPRFEREAMKRSGLILSNNWRRGDLVLIRASNAAPASRPCPTQTDESWESFVLGTQVVKLRLSTNGGEEKILAPLDEYPDFIFPSVSRRHPDRRQIDLWTSRNRVAKVGQRGAVVAILRHLQKDLNLDNLTKLAFMSSMSLKDRRELIKHLGLILDLRMGA